MRTMRCSFCVGPFQQACIYLAAWVACSCSSVLSLLTPATISSTVHCRVALDKITRSILFIYFFFLACMNPLHDSQCASSIRFKCLHDSFEIVLEVEKWPLPEVQPRFSFWTFGHLSSPCGALRWPPLSCGEAPKNHKRKKKSRTKPHDCNHNAWIINIL